MTKTTSTINDNTMHRGVKLYNSGLGWRRTAKVLGVSWTALYGRIARAKRKGLVISLRVPTKSFSLKGCHSWNWKGGLNQKEAAIAAAVVAEKEWTQSRYVETYLTCWYWRKMGANAKRQRRGRAWVDNGLSMNASNYSKMSVEQRKMWCRAMRQKYKHKRLLAHRGWVSRNRERLREYAARAQREMRDYVLRAKWRQGNATVQLSYDLALPDGGLDILRVGLTVRRMIQQQRNNERTIK
jgi:hypothetical protein